MFTYLRNPFIALLLGGFFIGLAAIFFRLSEMSPVWAVFYRMLFALPFIYFLCIFSSSNIPSLQLKNRRSYWISLIAALAFTFDLIGWHWGLKLTSISNATIIVNTAPIWVACYGILVLKEPWKISFLIPIFLTYFGITGLVTSFKDFSLVANLGDILSFLASLLYAIYLVCLSRLGEEHPFKVIFYTTFFCCLLSFPFALFESSSFLPKTPTHFIYLISLGVISQFLGQTLITYGMPRIKLSLGSMGLLMQPLTATIFGAWVFSEYLTQIQVLFAGISLWGIYLVRVVAHKN
ncbi:MAG: DMT family transporter [Gammaproteobacteria bacterium]